MGLKSHSRPLPVFILTEYWAVRTEEASHSSSVILQTQVEVAQRIDDQTQGQDSTFMLRLPVAG
jgi:hypothetical protein